MFEHDMFEQDIFEHGMCMFEGRKASRQAGRQEKSQNLNTKSPTKS